MYKWIRYGLVVMFFVVTVAWVRISVMNVSWVQSGSMQPNYAVQDRILVNQLAWGVNIPFLHTLMLPWNTPERGDVVLFHNPYDAQNIWMKRVIGLAGDRIAFHHHQLWINGQACRIDRQRMEYLPRQDGGTIAGHRIWFSWLEGEWGPVIVPTKHVFVMGDNRGASNDSRSWGSLDVKQLTGKPWLKLWPITFTTMR